MKNLRIDLTSTAFTVTEERERILSGCRELCNRCGVQFGVQLHNTCDLKQAEYFLERGVPLSGHAPLGQHFNWNFAAEDVSGIWEAVNDNVALFHRLGISATVFHGFFMTDLPVPAFGHGRSYDECMREIFRPELARWPGIPRNRNFTGTMEYLERRKRVKKNLESLRRRHPEIVFCLENDFPAYGSGSMLPEDLTYFGHPLCLDTGHLWVSARLFGMNFFAAASEIIASGNVKMVHFHASKYDDSYPDREWRDGHLPLSTPNAVGMRLPEIAAAAAAKGVNHFVLEVTRGNEEDVRLLLKYLGFNV